MPNSMTGYSVSKHIDNSCDVACEIKSVNHRFLEISTKPNDLSNKLDIFIRNTLQKKLERGAVDVRFKFNQTSLYSYSVNKKSLKNLGNLLSLEFIFVEISINNYCQFKKYFYVPD